MSAPTTHASDRETDVSATRVEGATAGALAAAAALVTSELLGRALPGRPSLLQGVGDRIVSSAPAAIREWLIGLVGTADKPLLLVGVVLILLAGSAAFGAYARHRASLFSAAVAVVAALATTFTVGPEVGGLLATAAIAVVGSFVGIRTYAWLIVRAQSSAHPYVDPLMPTRDRKKSPLDRRQFLKGAAWVSAGVAVGGAIAATARRAADNGVEAVRATLTIPKPSTPRPVVPAGANIEGIAPALTPAAEFYRIDTALYLPQVDLANWSLSLAGRVASPIAVTHEQLMAMPQVERIVTLTCVSNEIGGDLVGNARWQGVPLRDLLALAGGPTSGAEQVVGEAVDGFTAGFPLKLALDGREPLVALAMNGESLPIEHGFPARLVVPGLYGYVSATKWLREIRLTSFAEDVPFWLKREWAADGRIEAASRIDRPREGNEIVAGDYLVAGRAWHQHIGVGGVEVQVDDGPWNPATLADAMGVDAWRLWSWRWPATAGRHRLRVRMSDTTGVKQSAEERPVFPGASSGYHTISITVA